MKTSLTKREKAMILVVAYIAVAYLMFQFAIMPAYRYYQDETERNGILNEEKLLVDTKIGAMDTYIAIYEEHHARLEWINANYPPVMRNERIDDTLTGLCVANGLEPTKLSLSRVAINLDNSTSGQSNSTDEEKSKESAFVVVGANMTVNGSISQLLGLLNSVEEMDYIRVTRLTFSENYRASGYVELYAVLYFEVTMLNVTQ